MQRTSGKTCVIFSETYLPLLGGAEMYTYNFIKQLGRHGYVVTVFTHAGGEIPEEYRLSHTTVIYVPKVSKTHPWRLLRLFMRMVRLMRRSDLVFANYTYSLGMLTTLGGVLCNRRVSVFAHGLGTIVDTTHPRIYHLYRFVTLKLAAHVITTSQEIANIVLRYRAQAMVATAIDSATIDSRINAIRIAEIKERYQGKRIVLTVRRLVEKNGIQYLIEALPFLLRIHKDFVYLAIGDGRLRGALEARAAELDIADHVIFLGSVHNNEVFDYITAADVVVFPSSAEAISLAAIEVMHIGTPLLVSNIGGLRELVGAKEQRGTAIDLFGRTESVYTAPEAASLSKEVYERLAEQLFLVSSSSEEIRRKARQAVLFVDEHFNWPRVAERILQCVTSP